MRFLIDDKTFFRRNELDGAFTLMSLKTNQTFAFAKAADLIMKKSGQWQDFDQFIASIRTAQPEEKVRRIFSGVLYKLHAGGLALLEDVPKSDCTGARLAKKEDYYYLSEFARENFDKGFSCSEAGYAGYYSYAGIYNRIKNNEESVFMVEEKGVIKAALFASPSKHYYGSLIFQLVSFVFDQSLTKEQVSEYVRSLIDCVDASLRDSINKVRYEYINTRQDFVVNELIKCGFEKNAELDNEIMNQKHLILYDKYYIQ